MDEGKYLTADSWWIATNCEYCDNSFNMDERNTYLLWETDWGFAKCPACNKQNGRRIPKVVAKRLENLGKAQCCKVLCQIL